MMHKASYIILFSIIVCYFSCTNSPDFTIEPQIEFISFSTSQVGQSSVNDDSLTFILTISFSDGDGDIGYDLLDSDAPLDVLIMDNRTDFEYGQFRIPEVPTQGANNGITGEIALRLFSTCCVFPETTIPPCSNPGEFPTNELTLDISIQDRAGNRSNVVTTPPITLLCN